ncbi:MAG TPA: hypothetical protein VJ276_17075 [Thermoanaerobaculia bacterium]|nr:hypothetical protein [Thermoanaerobaculia bacterium]
MAVATKRPADVVREQLAPYVGAFTAKNAVQMGAKQIGTDAEHLTAAQVPSLLDALGPMMRTLLGKPTAEKVAAEIRREVGA